MNPLPLVNILADGAFHSGDELGRLLGVSRAAVWKAVKGFEALGLEVHSVKGKGYRLAGPLELLSREAILATLGEEQRRHIVGLSLLASVDSTNSHLLRGLQERILPLPTGGLQVCLAERQTAGRGRRGREWASPFGCNMYLSAAREFAGGAVALEGLSLVVALALVRALEDCGVRELGLKWPNDVLWRGRKLAGILLEMTGDVCGQCQVVIGIGLNIRQPGASMAAVDQPWVDLASIHPGAPGRNRVSGLVLDHLVRVLARFEAEGFSSFKDEWNWRDAYRDAPVRISAGSSAQGACEGVARGVDEHGALRLDTAEGIRLFHGGEVSMRGMETDDGSAR